MDERTRRKMPTFEEISKKLRLQRMWRIDDEESIKYYQNRIQQRDEQIIKLEAALDAAKEARDCE